MAIWSDINANVGLNGLPFLLTNDQALQGAIYNILKCPIGTRPWNPTFGSIIPDLLWENVSYRVAQQIRIAGITAIRKWEKRVQVVPSKCVVQLLPSMTGYDCQWEYIILATGTVGNLSFGLIK